MEATLQAISDLSDIRNIWIFLHLAIVFSKLEFYLVGEEEFQEEVHYLAVLLLLEVIIGKHSYTSTYD